MDVPIPVVIGEGKEPKNNSMHIPVRCDNADARACCIEARLANAQSRLVSEDHVADSNKQQANRYIVSAMYN